VIPWPFGPAFALSLKSEFSNLKLPFLA